MKKCNEIVSLVKPNTSLLELINWALFWKTYAFFACKMKKKVPERKNIRYLLLFSANTFIMML